MPKIVSGSGRRLGPFGPVGELASVGPSGRASDQLPFSSMSPSTVKRFATLFALLVLAVFGYVQLQSGATASANTGRMVVESSTAPEPATEVAGISREAHEADASSTSVVEESTPWTLLEEPPRRLPLPEQLLDRRLESVDVLPAPDGDTFASSVVTPPPAEVIARSSWEPDCPVGPDELSYLQVSFYGFDGEFHTGELVVAAAYADQIVEIFERLHELRFPIEQMVVVSQNDFGNPSNAYTNNTSGFECRQSVTSGRWSRHAYGDAIDINPFHNPYVSGGIVIPALAEAYVDRDREVPGLITTEITAMFEEIGWGWGGNWNSIKDWMHFSATGS